jgi:two-component system, LytTR family, response regulator
VNRSEAPDPAGLKVLIVDDERLARAKLRRFLSESPEVRVVGEAATGTEALKRIHEQRPDLVFLDIRMPAMDGFEILEKLPPDARPAIVFVTAHDEHAVRAFDAEAVDYLLKPFDRSRLRRALDRTRLARKRDPEELLGILRRLTALAAPERRALRRIAVRSEGRLHSYRVEDIHWFEGADNYVRLHTGRGVHGIRETLSELERRLDPERFVRIHRSAIVGIDAIREVESLFHGDFAVVLRTGERLAVGRTYRGRFLEAIGDRTKKTR